MEIVREEKSVSVRVFYSAEFLHATPEQYIPHMRNSPADRRFFAFRPLARGSTTSVSVAVRMQNPLVMLLFCRPSRRTQPILLLIRRERRGVLLEVHCAPKINAAGQRARHAQKAV